MKYKHIYFDLDRTLWDYNANAQKALTQIFNSRELKKFFTSADDFISRFDYYNELMWESYRSGDLKKEDLRNKRFSMVFAEKGIKDEDLANAIGSMYMELTPRMNMLFPNTLEILDYLSGKGYALYILTNGFLNTQKRKMKYSGLEDYFQNIFSSDELGVSKPNKEIFHIAVSSVHASKNECLMIGDDAKVDILGARNYGIDSIWFNPLGLSSDIKATYQIKDLQELEAIL